MKRKGKKVRMRPASTSSSLRRTNTTTASLLRLAVVNNLTVASRRGSASAAPKMEEDKKPDNDNQSDADTKAPDSNDLSPVSDGEGSRLATVLSNTPDFRAISRERSPSLFDASTINLKLRQSSAYDLSALGIDLKNESRVSGLRKSKRANNC